MKKNLLATITSLACFTLRSGTPLEATDYYIGTTTQGADVPSGCQDQCVTSGNICCEFLDACYEAALSPGTASNIIFTQTPITYTSYIPGFSNEYAIATLVSSVSGGTVIDFNGQTNAGNFVFQPTYLEGYTGSGAFTLNNVVFQNASVQPIDLAGGSLTILGTTLTNGSFSNNLWAAQSVNGQNPSFVFGPAVSGGSYTDPFSGALGYVASNTTLSITNNAGTPVTISGNFTSNSFTNSNLQVSGVSGDTYFTGSITMDLLELTSGTMYLEPASGSNTIGTINLLSNTFLHVNSNNSLGAVTTINSSPGSTLLFEPSGTYPNAFTSNITYGGSGTFTLTNNSTTTIELSGSISEGNYSGSTLNVTGSSIVSLTGTVTIGTLGVIGSSFIDVYLQPVSGSNNIGTVNLQNGTLHINSNSSLGGISSINPSGSSNLAFEIGSYSGAITTPIYYAADNTTFTLATNSGTTIDLSGNISSNSHTNSALNISPINGSTRLTGSINIGTLSTTNGTTYLFPNVEVGNSNSITTVNITYSNLRIDSNQSFGSGTTINIEDFGELTLENTFTSTPLSSTFTINLASAPGSTGANQVDDGGYITQIDSTVTGTGTYFKQGIGLQTLTQTNSYAGGTIVNLGTLSIPAIGALGTGNTLTLQNNGGLYASQGLTIPVGTAVSIQASGGALSAAAGTILEVAGPITASGPLQIGTSAPVTSSSGSILLSNSSNSFSGNTITVGTVSGTTTYPALLSADDTTLSGLGGLILQYGSIFTGSTATATLSAPITLGGGSAILYSSDNLTLSGPISSASGLSAYSSLTLDGGGTVVFSGDNSSFTNDLLIGNATTLQVENTNNLGANNSSTQLGLYEGTLHVTGTGGITSNRLLAIGGNNTITIDGTNSAAFNGPIFWDTEDFLTKQGAGPLSILPSSDPNLSNDSILGITVAEGTLTGNTFFFKSNNVTVDAGASAIFYQTSDGTFSGTISGAGYVSITGTAPLTFTPTSSTYTGGTLVSSPLIILQDVLGAATAPISMGNGSSLQTLSSFSMSHYTTVSGNTTFSQNPGTVLQMQGSLAGSGSLNKTGTGALILSGNSPGYNGIITVSEGALVVNGNLSNSGDPIVAEEAILSGTGSIGTTDVFGTIKGGNPLGTLNIHGDLTFERGSHFGTILAPNNSSFVIASGDITINPNTNYLIGLTPGSYVGSDIVVLRGNSITGQFAEISSATSLAAYFFSHNIVYTGTEVILAITQKSIVPLASGQNAIHVANALDNAIHFNRTQVTYTIEPGHVSADPSPQLPEVLFSLLPMSSDPTAMTYALNELHPAQLKGMAISQESAIVQVREALSQRMQNELDLTNCDPHNDSTCARNKKTMTPWISGIGESLGQSTENNSWGPLTGYRANMGGFGAGIDGRFAQNFYAGALTGYTHSHLHWKEDKGEGNISSGYAGLYLSGLGKMFYGNASVIGSWNEYSTDRNISYGFVNKTAKNNHSGRQILSHLDTGINFDFLDLTIRPFDSFDYISQIEKSYTEHNAGEWNLHVRKNNEIMIRNELGLQLAQCFCAWNCKWTVAPKLSWIYESRVKGDHFVVNFVDGGTPFLIEGYFPDRSLFAPGLVMTGMMLQDTLAFNLYYNGEFGSGYSANTYGGQVRYAF